MEFLLLDKRNVELVNSKLKVVHAAFVNYERAHTVYLESLDGTEEIQRATSEYESRPIHFPKFYHGAFCCL